MRNPLTAILQLADGISQSMKGLQEDTADYLAVAKSNVDSANTILACAAHQKRIIDDVLILSRLESDMLSFSLIPATPISVIHSTLRMFSGEVKMNGVSIEAVREPSYDKLQIDHTLIDPSRLVSSPENIAVVDKQSLTLCSRRKCSSTCLETYGYRPPKSLLCLLTLLFRPSSLQ